jgi:TPR repeat protein
MHARGTGVREDFTEAVKWYTLTAEQGDAQAQSNLGVMYCQGTGVKQDFTKAAKWYMLAAKQGDAGAQFNLGSMHEKDEGGSQSFTEAAKWYKLAAVQGFALGQAHLGLLYVEGNGVLKDITEAARWLKLAAKNGNANALLVFRMMLDQDLFPAGTKVMLVDLTATMLNGMCGVVVQRGGEGAARAAARAAVEEAEMEAVCAVMAEAAAASPLAFGNAVRQRPGASFHVREPATDLTPCPVGGGGDGNCSNSC